jgi:nitrate reductase NapAB chaperone NapD
MPVCSYLVIPETGAVERLAARLAALPGCEVAPAENRDLLLLVTDTPDTETDRKLRRTVEDMEGIHALVLTFGEIDPETEEADTLAGRKGKRRRPFPVVDPGGLGLGGAGVPEAPGPASPRAPEKP